MRVLWGMLALLVPLLALSGTAAAQAAPDPAREEPAAALRALFAKSDEASLRRNPLSALLRGDLRYADRLGDIGSAGYYAAERAAAEADLAALGRIDRSRLGPEDRIAYDVFQFQTEAALRGLSDAMLALTAVRPINHEGGFHIYYPTLVSGTGAAPFKTIADYENNLKRHKDYVRFLDRSIARFREGLASGVLESRLTIGNVVGQLDRQLADAPEASPFFAPALNFPEDFPTAEKARLRAAYRAAVEEEIFPAYRRLRAFLKADYLPKARVGVGLVHMKGGRDLYAHLIREHTTLPLGADEIHALGLGEVARIAGEMEAVRKEVGFSGTLAQFFEHVRTDPKFQPASADWLRERYYAIGRTVNARIGEQFAVLPKTPLEIRPVESYRERNAAGGSYSLGAPDGSRPGIFYYNTYDLPSRTTPNMESLYLHEGAPGHHFQLSIAQENAALPAFLRFGGNTAFIEGWALYTETLGRALGLYTDPYQRFGALNDEMLRAMRLVVDTGLHAKGWTRERAIDYMLANSGLSRTETVSEVERYIADPGQALAYKIGALTIERLKRKAQDALGAGFDPRDFHAQLLMTGALPMTVLERKIDDWIAGRDRTARQ